MKVGGGGREGRKRKTAARNEEKRLFSQAKFLQFNFSPHIASPVQGPLVFNFSFPFVQKHFLA